MSKSVAKNTEITLNFVSLVPCNINIMIIIGNTSTDLLHFCVFDFYSVSCVVCKCGTCAYEIVIKETTKTLLFVLL